MKRAPSPQKVRLPRTGTSAVATTETTRAANRASDLSRVEIVLVVLILAGGILLRIAFPQRMAVEHFDEGVYASNLWFDAESGGRYPARQLYAPPLLPALIESSLLAEQVFAGAATRPSGWAAMAPSLLAGCFTLWIVWWVTRTWFDPAAAMGATMLAAGNEFHALYARTALTDVLLLPWMLLAVFLFERAVAARQPRLLLLAGLACGLAWWTKYNGWLPLLIGLGGIGLRLVLVQAAWRSAGRDLAYWAGFVTVAAAVWSPYLWTLQATGGYAQVLANHRGYVVGLSGWPQSLVVQLANLTHFDGWISCLAPAAALLLVWIYRLRIPSRDRQFDAAGARPDLFIGIVLAGASIALAAWLGLAVVLSYLAVSGLLAACRRERKQANRDAAAGRLAVWLVAAWFAGLFALTPLYSPYPRLTLTWLCASWLAGGLGLAVLSHDCVSGVAAGRVAAGRVAAGRVAAGRRNSFLRCGLVFLLVVALGAVFASHRRVTARGFPAWQDRSGLETAASSIKALIDADNAVVFVQGEPGLFFQLRAAGVYAVPGFDFQRSPAALPDGIAAYLATGLHAQRSEEFQRQLAAGKSGLAEVASIPYQPSDLVLLNNYRADQLPEQRRAAWRVRLYRIK